MWQVEIPGHHMLGRFPGSLAVRDKNIVNSLAILAYLGSSARCARCGTRISLGSSLVT